MINGKDDWIALHELQWGRVGEDAEVSPSSTRRSMRSCFNGAASVRTRKLGGDSRDGSGTLALQWGRVGEDAEVAI